MRADIAEALAYRELRPKCCYTCEYVSFDDFNEDYNSDGIDMFVCEYGNAEPWEGDINYRIRMCVQPYGICSQYQPSKEENYFDGRF